MKIKYAFILLVFVITSAKAQNTIALWNYNSISAAAVLTTSADVGTGVGTIVGSLSASANNTGMDPIINNGCGTQNGTAPGAWSFTANPGAANQSSGVQYMASTVGNYNINFTWDQRASNTSANTIRLKYTTDGVTWNDFTMTAANTTFCNGSINANGCFEHNTTGDIYRRISVSFAGMPSVENNPNFGVRLLASHYQATGQFRQTLTPASIASGGTWRFDNVKIEGRANVSIPAASNFAQYNENVGTINVPITVSNANASPIVLNFALSTYTSATVSTDFTWTGTLTIPANTNGITNMPITIIDDALAENAERIIVKISSATNAIISATDYYQINFIKDNDYVAPTPTNEINLSLLTSFSNGAPVVNSAEIVTFDKDVDRLYIANSIAGKLDIVNFSNPSNPVLINSIVLSAYGNINSVVAHDSVVAMAIESVPAQNNGSVVFFDYNGNFISQVTVGAMPDMITFNKTYTKIITANEGEPDATYANDPEGSVSIVDLTPGYANLTNANVTTLGFTSYNGQAASLIAQGIRIFATSASVAQDLEPEYVAVSDDNTKAYVTIQENNALATIDLTTNTLTSLTALGYSSYNTVSGNAMDASDQSGAVLITGSLPVKGAYMPDAIDFYTAGGTGYLVTANEGDSREFGSVIDANRISSATFSQLDATAFPDQAILKNNKFLGRLNALKYSGDTDGDGDYDELHVMGGRSFSIRNAATGAVVFDSKALLEQITANHPTFGAIFNASNATGVPALKNRSDDKGPEPEGIEIASLYGSTYAFVGLERIGGAAMFNIDNPAAPVFVGYVNNRSTSVSGPDLGTEGIIFISAADSPNGNALLILANEVSSTLSIYQINSCAELSGTPITTPTTNICAGQNATLSATIVPNVSYEWLLNGSPIANATSSTYAASQAGIYTLKFTNPTYGCVDTSNAINFTVFALPSVGSGAAQTVCSGSPVTLTGTGAFTYAWDNGVNNGIAFSPLNTQNYTVTGTDTNGCVNTAQVTITVNSLPAVTAGNNQTVCAGTSVNLNGSGALTYVWNNGVTNNTPFSPLTTQTYSVTGTDVNGCTNTAQVTVTVNALPTVSAGVNQTVCAGLPVTLSGSGATTYTWDNGVVDGVSFTPLATQTYTVTGTDANGCVNSAGVTVNVNPLPNVSAGTNQTVCSGSSVILSGFGATNYTWNNGVINGASFTPIATQTYTVTGTLANGCVNTAQVTITVNGLPTVTAGNNQTICAGTPVILNGSGALTYVWNNGVTNNTPFSPLTTQTYSVTGTDVNGCTNSAQVTVTVNTLPTVSAGVNQTVCAGLPVTLSGSGAATYAWNNGVINGASFTPLATQTYTVTGTDANGCVNSANVTVNVNPLPNVSAVTNQTVCSGNSVILSGAGATSYTWNNGVTNGIAFTPITTQTYTVVGTLANGCANVAQVTVTVNNVPTVNAGTNQTVCAGTAVTLLGSGAPTLTWNNAILDGIAFTPTGTLTYTLTGTSANGCTDTAQVTVTVNAVPVVNVGANQTVCAGTSVTLTATGANTYSWNNGVANGVSFIPTSTQLYTATGSNANGCTDTAQVIVTVNPNPTVALGSDTTVCDYNFPISVLANASSGSALSWSNGSTANPVLVNGAITLAVSVTNNFNCTDTDTIIITADPCAGLDENAFTLSVYPNPFTNTIQVESSIAIDSDLFVYSSEGRLVATLHMFGTEKEINLGDLARGNYFLHFTVEGNTQVLKLIKQ